LPVPWLTLARLKGIAVTHPWNSFSPWTEEPAVKLERKLLRRVASLESVLMAGLRRASTVDVDLAIQMVVTAARAAFPAIGSKAS